MMTYSVLALHVH